MTIDSLHHIPDRFLETIEQYLNEHLTGFKEIELLNYLKDQRFFDNKNLKNSPSLSLFVKHFLLFHALYFINDRYVLNKSAFIKISPLLIQKLPYAIASQEIGEFDPLREYYLNLENIKKASEETVDELFNSFWTLYLRNDNRSAALATLGLCDPVTDQEIKSTYRQLVTNHHPDKGGDKTKMQEINIAYGNLCKEKV